MRDYDLLKVFDFEISSDTDFPVVFRDFMRQKYSKIKNGDLTEQEKEDLLKQAVFVGYLVTSAVEKNKVQMPNYLIEEIIAYLREPEKFCDIMFLRLLSDFLKHSVDGVPDEKTAQLAAFLLKCLEKDLSSFPLDDIASIFEACISRNGVRAAYG